METTYDGQVALVTGVSAGMGLATAQAFVTAGAAVELADINEAASREQAERLVAEGHQVMALGCDVTDEDQVAAMVDRTVASFGRMTPASISPA